MKFTLFPLIALMAVPGFAQVLDKPVNVVIATDWKNGYVDGVYINGLQQDKKIPVKTTDETPVTTLELYEVKSFELDHIGAKHTFKMERDKWVRDYFECTVTLIKDPGIPIVHILLMGNNDDKLDDGDYKVNGYGDQVQMKCDKKNVDEELKAGN